MTPADATPRTTPLAPRLVAEVRELHDRNLALSRDAGGPRGRRGRRERREARDAESDLLRVLGFPSFEAFVAYVDGPPASPRAPGAVSGVTLSLVDELAEGPGSASAAALDAEETEAALLRVLRGEHRRPARERSDAPDVDEELVLGPTPGGLADLHARIAYFEEELAETRFELGRMRDRVAKASNAAEVDSTNAIPAAAEALTHAAAELRSLSELLRAERTELMSLAADARAEAERVLATARADAQALRDEAAAAARAVLDQASADAIALTRNAISTVDGLRRLAGEERDRSDDAS